MGSCRGISRGDESFTLEDNCLSFHERLVHTLAEQCGIVEATNSVALPIGKKVLDFQALSSQGGITD
jgi:hypothetical protein